MLEIDKKLVQKWGGLEKNPLESKKKYQIRITSNQSQYQIRIKSLNKKSS